MLTLPGDFTVFLTVPRALDSRWNILAGIRSEGNQQFLASTPAVYVCVPVKGAARGDHVVTWWQDGEARSTLERSTHHC